MELAPNDQPKGFDLFGKKKDTIYRDSSKDEKNEQTIFKRQSIELIDLKARDKIKYRELLRI